LADGHHVNLLTFDPENVDMPWWSHLLSLFKAVAIVKQFSEEETVYPNFLIYLVWAAWDRKFYRHICEYKKISLLVVIIAKRFLASKPCFLKRITVIISHKKGNAHVKEYLVGRYALRANGLLLCKILQ